MQNNNNRQYFVDQSSVVRKIWGRSDIILFIFAGAAAEFALNKAVHWLYFTGKLPADPLGRMFSTVSYAKKIVFAPTAEANKAIDTIRHIHTSVEKARGATIPDWAYRDVLFMLIYYSIAACELFEHKLSAEEKEEVYQVFYRVGVRMGLKELPLDYAGWLPMRESHLINDFEKTEYTVDLFKQYRKHLGPMRYKLLIEGQKLVIPSRIKQLLHLRNVAFLKPVIPVYKISRRMKMDWILKDLLLPHNYKKQIKELDTWS